MIFSFVQKNWVLGYSWSTSYGIGATIRIGREMLGLPYAGFLSRDSTVGGRLPCRDSTVGERLSYRDSAVGETIHTMKVIV